MSSSTIAMLINSFVLLLILAGTFVLVWKMKFEDNNSRVIFLLYIVYWVAPLLCRDYTTSMHIHMDISNKVALMWIPVAAFGFIGILWRPLNDILTYRTKSRKLVVFLSIIIQALTLLPFLLYPCFETNLVQSIGTGIGASGIGLFTLMFNEGQKKHKTFLNISIFALPPIIAGFIVSAIESFVASYAPTEHSGSEYIGVVWYIWLIALIFVLVSFIMTFFVGEKRETLYQDKKYKTPVVKASGHWKIILLCLCGACLAFFRWASAGPFAGMQLTYIAQKFPITGSNTSLWEGYLGLVYSFGCLVGSIISSLAIVKSKSDKYQPIIVAIAVACWIIYLGITCSFINVPTYFWLEILNGIGFGLLWNIFLQLVLNKFYINRDIVTPIGFYNMSLSIGIVIGAIFIGFTKAQFFDFHAITQPDPSVFKTINQMTSLVLLVSSIFMLLIFVAYYLLDTKTKVRRKLTDKHVAMIGENEL